MLLKEFPNIFEMSISYTARDPRPGETNGKEYYFITEKQFKEMIRNNMFVEYCIVHGKLYGTAKSELERICKGHKIAILEIDVEGAKKVSNSGVKANYLFIYPPELDTLKERITKRGTENEEAIKIRLKNAITELTFAKLSPLYRYKIVNGDLETSYKELKNLVMKLYKEAVKIVEDKSK